MMVKRKAPVRHHVKAHKRRGETIQGFWRGKESPHLKKIVVKPIVGLNKRLLSTVGGYKIYLVNGTYVRDHYDMGFTMGTHGYVDSFVAKDEIWIDDELSEFECESLIRHELHEAELMRDGASYEDAHAESLKHEERFRERVGTYRRGHGAQEVKHRRVVDRDTLADAPNKGHDFSDIPHSKLPQFITEDGHEWSLFTSTASPSRRFAVGLKDSWALRESGYDKVYVNVKKVKDGYATYYRGEMTGVRER